jgi:chitin disaccharide deacetylase
MERKLLVVNADDFGASAGVNRGIAEAHSKGIVTSTSVQVTGAACGEAVRMAADLPDLGLGLHVDVCGEDERPFDVHDIDAVRAEFEQQLDRFCQLFGRPPTHVDSHRHIHRHSFLRPLFRELAEPLGVPVRDDGRVRFVGDFYAQWEWGVTDLDKVGVPFLQELLRNKVLPGWTELSCHPGYRASGYEPIYDAEREAELATLTDPTVRHMIDELGIELVTFAAYPTGAS